MKSGRVIDISKSSLISLKAELSRKQEEVEKAKLKETYIRPVPKLKKEPKRNAGVEERSNKDVEITEEEVNLLKKSKEVLELKTSLYNKLQSGHLVQEPGKSDYLVDFKQKADDYVSENDNVKTDGTALEIDESANQKDSDHSDSFSDSDSEWADYTDCLGRTRKCLKEDLPLVKSRDDRLAESLHLKKPAMSDEKSPEDASTNTEALPDLMSNDMHRELLRQKWEEEEKKLADKKNIYYEDVRFDEARTHGVSYFKFSTDDAVREEQQEMLKKVRSETEKRQEEAKALRERRERQKQARLMAARQRQRARLGLPPIEINEELEFKEEVKETKEEEKEDTTREMLEVALKKAAHVRPWDIGKDGVKKPVMTQEEWVEMKRDERMDEFAPSYEQKKQELASSKPIKKKKRKLFNQPDIQQTFEPSCSNILVSNATSSDNTEENFPKRRGVAIPPPPSFDYYNPSSNRNSKLKKPVLNNLGTEEAIEAGLKYLREQYESKATDEKGLLDII